MPSECLPGLADEFGDWFCYCFDNAIHAFVAVIENALREANAIGVGASRSSEAKYTLTQLLDDSFRLPRPFDRKNSLDALRGMFGKGKKKRKGAMITSQGFHLPPTIAKQYEAMLTAKGKKL